MRRAARAVTLVALLGAAQPAGACAPHLKGAGIEMIEGRRYVLAWRPATTIHVSEFFALEVALCSREGQPRVSTLRVDAQMPEHRHGMNYRASVRPQGPDRFIVEGLLLHMPGRWEFTFEVNAGADRESLRASVQVD
jgi:hypothetical protein